MIKATLFADTKCILGEGSWYDQKNSKLYWLDIFGCKVFVHDFKTEERKVYQLDKYVTTIVPKEDGTGFVLGMRDGVYACDNEFTEFKALDVDDDFTNRRCNDGKCAPDGKLWVGTMELHGAAGEGVQFVVGDDGAYREISNIDVPNGIVWTADQKTMYFNDTLKGQIYAYDYVPGHVSNQRVIYTLDEKCYTDGMAIDENDNLWIALHGAGKVIYIDPRKGELLDYVEVPCTQPTSVAIGNGKLYITSARESLSDELLEKYPYSGGVFVADIPVKGVASFYYKG